MDYGQIYEEQNKNRCPRILLKNIPLIVVATEFLRQMCLQSYIIIVLINKKLSSQEEEETEFVPQIKSTLSRKVG